MTPPHRRTNVETIAIARAETPSPDSRVKRLRSATAAAHDQLDKRIMACQPFADLERYGLFLKIQYRFHTVVDRLYLDGAFGRMLPDLTGRRRLALIEQDIRDVNGIILEEPVESPAAIDPEGDLGWLYVAEGSNLGAAILLKEARALGLSEAHGARHLAGHPDGRGLHWRQFAGALDLIELSASGEQRAIDGASDAFRFVHRLVGDAFA
ncbi:MULTISPECIES: biliverdin-producing heme oxygenase [unclassified Methylobacterium]|uniref:biliverdin-producing heme oxygenase n=1 Tax=unclassified Methylobacterium TaxID=2615210 RepID=UPI001FEE89D6|nr:MULTISPECIES: biliverdin-producing heme oxygenase [unclassified Methylobacterium]